MAASALGFFYGRLAILEPAFVMFLLLAIYLAGKVRRIATPWPPGWSCIRGGNPDQIHRAVSIAGGAVSHLGKQSS